MSFSRRVRLCIHTFVAVLLLVGIIVSGVARLSADELLFEQQTTLLHPDAAQDAQQDFIRWALTQGGLTLALLVVLWSYRRDLRRFADQELLAVRVQSENAEKRTKEFQAQLSMLVNIVQTTTAAHEKATAASLAQHESIDRLIGTLEGFVCPVTAEGDHPFRQKEKGKR